MNKRRWLAAFFDCKRCFPLRTRLRGRHAIFLFFSCKRCFPLRTRLRGRHAIFYFLVASGVSHSERAYEAGTPFSFLWLQGRGPEADWRQPGGSAASSLPPVCLRAARKRGRPRKRGAPSQEGGALARGGRPRKREAPSQEGGALARGGRPRKRVAGRSSCVCLQL